MTTTEAGNAPEPQPCRINDATGGCLDCHELTYYFNGRWTHERPAHLERKQP